MRSFHKVMGSVAVLAALSAASAFGASGIATTKHNLSYTGTGTIKSVAGDNNDEICVYCHTPHASNTAFLGAPLWNKASPSGSFMMYGGTVAGNAGVTSAGTVVAAAPASPSMACLSCHDGVSAINSMVNAPGSGGYTVGGANVKFGTLAAAGVAYAMPAGITNIGSGAVQNDLRNDHPISVDYNGSNSNTDLNPASLRQTSFTLTGWAGATSVLGLLRNSKVECGSCHDPHIAATATNQTFLRVANTGSALCLGCHAK